MAKQKPIAEEVKMKRWTIDECLAVAQRIDEMEREVSNWEADFLENVLSWLRAGNRLSEKQEFHLFRMNERYFGGDMP